MNYILVWTIRHLKNMISNPNKYSLYCLSKPQLIRMLNSMNLLKEQQKNLNLINFIIFNLQVAKILFLSRLLTFRSSRKKPLVRARMNKFKLWKQRILNKLFRIGLSILKSRLISGSLHSPKLMSKSRLASFQG